MDAWNICAALRHIQMPYLASERCSRNRGTAVCIEMVAPRSLQGLTTLTVDLDNVIMKSDQCSAS